MVAAYRIGAVVTTVIPGVQDTKARPAIVLADLGDADLIVAPVTRIGPRSEYDIPVTQWQSVGLQAACYVRANKPVTITKSDVRVSVGSLIDPDLENLKNALRKFWASALAS